MIGALTRLAKGVHARMKRGGSNVALPRPLFLLIRHLLRPGLTDLLARELRRGDVVVDVGANIGYYSALAAKLVGPEGRVLALEPDPAHFARLRRSLAANRCRNAVPLQLAAADREGGLDLYLSEENSSDHACYPVPGRRRVPVRAVDLDGLVEEQGLPRVDLVKIDVQGFEPAVLRGMRGLLARNPGMRVVSELWPEGLRRAGFDPEEHLRDLADLGFALHLVEERRGRARPVNAAEALALCGERGWIDLLLTRGDEGERP
jgi:FkbM family methyltransferase